MKRIIAILIVLIGILIGLMITNEQKVLVIETESNVLTNNYITDVLFKEKNKSEVVVYPDNIEESSNLYQNGNNYYFKEKNIKLLNRVFPIYTTNNTEIINIDEKSKLINEEFKLSDNYFGTILVNGGLYNKDKTKADNNVYLFLKTSNNLLINSIPIKITTLNNTYELPVNSILNFTDKGIKYYSIESNIFRYKEISDVDGTTKVEINKKTMSYNDLLLNLGKKKIAEELIEIVEPIEEKIEEIIEQVEENKTEPEEQPVIYIEPNITIGDFESNVYSIKNNILVYDPSKVITTPLTVLVKKDNKIILRKVFYTSGEIEIGGLTPNEEYEIEVEYTYQNENGKKLTNHLKQQKIKTKDISELETIRLEKENGKTYSSKIEINNIRITSQIDNQIRQGVKQGIVLINNDEYKMSQADLSSLLSGNSINYISPDKIKSNRKINYEIIFYDMYGNKFKIENNTGELRTCKKEPTTKIKITGIDILNANFDVKIENPDDINIQNYRYIVYDQNLEIVSEGLIDNDKIKVTNLDPSGAYTLKIFGDYDIEDGQGSKKNNELGSTKFIVPSLSSLGYIRANLQAENITSSGAKLTVSLDLEKTDYRLVFLMSKFEISLTDQNETVYNYKIENEELETLKSGQPLEIDVNNLKSNTTYSVICTSVLKTGTKENIVNTIYDMKTLSTLKQQPQVLIKNKFSAETMIDFDVSIEDIDNAILDGKVTMQVRDSENKLIANEIINTNDEYQRFTYNKLETNKEYTFIFTAQEYNIGNTNVTYIDNYELKKLVYETKFGINGQVNLNQMITIPLSKNLYDFEKNTKNLSSTANYGLYKKNEKIKFVMQNTSANLITFAPDIDVEPNTTYTFSFDTEMNKPYGTTGLYVYDISNGQKTISVTNMSTSDKRVYKFKTGATTTRIKLSMYIGGINTTTGNNKLEEGDTVTYSNIQLEKGDKVTSYEPFRSNGKYEATLSVNLHDTNEEITNNKYFLDIYRNGRFESRNRYSMNELHEIIDDIHTIDVERNSEYEIRLVIQIEERTYEIAYLSFTTEKEIRSIKTVDDLFNMTPDGKYVVINDLDLTGIYRTYTTTFTGEIDFQGHTVKRNVKRASSYVLQTIGSTGVVKNLVLDITIDNTIERQNWYGFFYENHGNINNVMVTLNSSTNFPNVGQSLLIWRNREKGVIDTFVVNTKEPIHGLRELSLVAINNYGTIRNGYVYGEGIDATYNNESTSQKNVGLIAAYTYSNSIIENVYTLADLNVYNEGEYNKQVGALVGNSYRTLVKNSYSVTDGKLENKTNDVSIGYVSGNYISNNVYYVSDVIYTGNYSQKVSPLALSDIDFQNNTLNSYGKFKVDENVSKGYYPHVIFNECMPRQEFIEIKQAEDSDLVDIISSETLETSGDEATIKLTINNPSMETIESIDIKYLTTEILAQNDYDGKSDITIKVTNPSKYLSKYSIMTINSKGAYNKIYSRNYQENERKIDIELYRKITNLNEWRLINTYPSENFKLENDLDFAGAINFIITKKFSGKLNGNNHTIKNILIEEQDGLINSFSGTLENLFVENYKKTSKTSYGGLIGQASGSPTIKNVHMTNVDINGGRSGGIIGYATYITISDSSVTNFKVHISNTLYEVYIGGIIGYVNDVGYIQNCYVQDVDVEVLDTLKTTSVGAIVGYLQGGIIENAYSTGNIKANATLGIGGIAGRSNGIIRKVYSYVNIENKFEYVGGITGYDSASPTNSLAIGNIYSNSKDNYLRRTRGNGIASVTLNNFAYEKQLINGYETEINFGESLLTYDQLNESSTYSVIIQLGEGFDYSEVDEKHILPKLYGSDGNLLPNQKDNKINLETNKVEILDVDQGVTDGRVYLSIDNPENYPVESIEFDYLKIKSVNLNENKNGKTYINVTVEPDRYYDTYKLEKINFSVDGEIKTINKAARIELIYYKNLETFEDWQHVEDTNENYRLVADIDFDNKVNINKNISFGRLEGTDEGHTLKNINLSFTGNYQALIRNISKNLDKVNFENITISNNSTGSYFGIILYNSGNVSNVNFKDITINASKIINVGSISYNMGKSLTNISLENMNISGKESVGSFIGRTTGQSITTTQYITLKNATVRGTTQVGGAIGYQAYTAAEAKNLNYTVYDVNVTGTGNYVGGVFGVYGSMKNSTAEKITVKGVSNVGGISGYSYDYMGNVTARDVHVTGSGQAIGGLAGYSLYIYTSYLYDSDVTGTTTSSNNVGGLVGNSSYNYTLTQSGATNVKVKSLGSNVGGLRGYQGSSISYCFVYNGVVEGNSNVGGATGQFVQGTIAHTSINAKVKANGNHAGGLVGYIKNRYTTNANYVSTAYNNMILNTTVESTTYAGGLIGRTDTSLYPGHYYNNLVVADVVTTNQDGNISISVGSDSSNIVLIKNFRTYRKSTLNGMNVEDTTTNYLDETNLYSLDDLKINSSYTSMGLSSTYFDLTQLPKGYFPLIKTSNTAIVPNQTPIELPKEIVTMGMRRMMMSKMTRQVHELPNMYVYQSDIDKINIEFSSVDPYTQMKIYQNGILLETKDISKRVYTYKYDFDSEITIEITDGLSTKTETYSGKNLNSEASVFNNNYAYIKQNKLKSNLGQIEGNFVNLYRNLALSKDGIIYNLEEKTQIGKIDKKIEEVDIKPLYIFDYDGSQIKTYKTYSEMNGNIIEYQLIVKNNKLHTLDSSLPIIKNSIILDNYGNKNYESILCKDGYIYDLNTRLNVPKNFNNSRITYMTNNIYDNSSYVLVIYEDQTVYGFDYRTGKEILNDRTYVDISVTEYLYNSFVKPENIMPKDSTAQYNNAVELKDKLVINPIEKILKAKMNSENYIETEIQELQINNSDKYLIVYDFVKQDYVIYNKEQLLNNFVNIESEEIKTIKPENNKIEENIELYNYYKNKTALGNRQKVINRIIIFVIILILIILSLISYLKNTKKIVKNS